MRRAAVPLLERLAPPTVGHPIVLDYPVSVAARWGHGRPAHPELAARIGAGDERYRALLTDFRRFLPGLLAIPDVADDDRQPMWSNDWFRGLDGAALYALLASRRPRRYLEVGSGWSTRFARRAVDDHGLETEITSIDPSPRAEIDQLCHRVVRSHLEDVDLALFEALAPGDVCFIDGSHYVLPNSDATVTFLDVLPRLAPGVLVHFHDIFLPWDYSAFFYERYYSEQYVLAGILLGGDWLEVVLPSFHVGQDPSLHGILEELWATLRPSGSTPFGTSFWVEVRERPR